MKLQNVFKEHFIQRFHSIKPFKPQQKQLVRLGCASLAVVLAVGAVPFLRGFAAEGEILSGSDISSEDIENPSQDIENPSQDIENPSQNGKEVSDSDNTVIRGETEPTEKQGNSGTCGTNATWSLSDDGTLTISGTGEFTSGNFEEVIADVKKVVIESGITNIPDMAFFAFGNLQSITIPSTVTSIGASAFDQCGNLQSITIPSSVTSIGEYAFSFCSILSSVTVHSGSVFLKYNHFNECSRIKTFEYKCSSVTDVILINFTGSTTVKVPTGFKVGGTELTQENKSSYFGSAVLEIFTPVTGVTLEQNTLAMNTGETTRLTATVEPDGASNKNVSWTSSDESVATVSGDGTVEAVGEGQATITVTTNDGSFTAECAVTFSAIPVTGVTLDNNALGLLSEETAVLTATVEPNSATDKNVAWTSSDESVATVSGDGTVTAVNGGTATITVTTNDGGFTAECAVTVNKCGDSAYWSLTADGEFTISGTGKVTSVNWTAKKSSIKNVVIQSGITNIPQDSFSSCSKLQNATIPPTVTEIGESAFSDCTGMKGITLPEGVQSMGTLAFYNCEKLQTVTIPSSMKKISSWTFANCVGITELIIPEGVEEIELCAFMGCAGMRSVTIPSTLNTIGVNAFDTNGYLRKVYYSCAMSGQKLNELKPSFEKNSTPDYEALHDLTYYAGKAATCEEAGNIEYWRCSVCDRIFSDQTCKSEIQDSVVIPATGHDWSEWKVTSEPNPLKSGRRRRFCKHEGCDAHETEILRPTGYTSKYVFVPDGTDEGGAASAKAPRYEWKKDSDDELLIVIKGVKNDKDTFRNFTGEVYIDGKKLHMKHFKAVKGSLRLTIKPSYIKTLDTGNHTIVIGFTDGYVANSFKVVYEYTSEPSPGTGESGAPTAAAAALILLASYCIVFTVRRRLDPVVE